MQTWLQDNWQIEATVLHDKPPLFFKPTPLDVQHELFSRVGDQISHCSDVRGSALANSSLRIISSTN